MKEKILKYAPSGYESRSIVKFNSSNYQNIFDPVAKESPLIIQLAHISFQGPMDFVVSMRSPGKDRLLALGLLFAENIIKKASDIKAIAYPDEDTIRIYLADTLEVDSRISRRNLISTSACGICSKAQFKIKKQHHPKEIKIRKILSKDILKLLQTADNCNNSFSKTGGNHTVFLCDQNAALISYHEDIGRHNAMDKLLGELLSDDLLPIGNKIILLSGRASYELIQKAIMGLANIVVSIGAPSTMAIDLAKDHQITLIGFLKKSSFNIYNDIGRIQTYEN